MPSFYSHLSPQSSTSNIFIQPFYRQIQKKKRRGYRIPHCTIVHQEFGATVRGQCPSWEELGIATGLAAGCAKMMLGSFRPILLGALPGAEWITGPWIGQDGAGIWRMHWQLIPCCAWGEYWSWWWLRKVIHRHLDLMGVLGSLLRWAKLGLGSWLGWRLE